ncbi:hypothetical protein ACFTXM_48560 [Streptomyces sp. NPDC056930]|uniref:hypothetical protein n=1 Tax=Streptomyces sp. NPDC056930 TaxID=3345967 RepID=UPI0036407ED5
MCHRPDAPTRQEDHDESLRPRVPAALAGARRVPGGDVPEPKDGEVLARTLWSGVSRGTEMPMFRGLPAGGLAALCHRIRYEE